MTPDFARTAEVAGGLVCITSIVAFVALAVDLRGWRRWRIR